MSNSPDKLGFEETDNEDLCRKPQLIRMYNIVIEAKWPLKGKKTVELVKY